MTSPILPAILAAFGFALTGLAASGSGVQSASGPAALAGAALMLVAAMAALTRLASERRAVRVRSTR